MTLSLPRPIARLSLLVGLLLLVTLIVACRTVGPEEQTPAPTIGSPSLVPQEVPITTLLRNPASFEGQTIWVTGEYRALPLLVCGGETHRPPATWTLVFGDVEAFAAGFDEALRPLANTGLSLTVEGRWQQWEGPVGCGRRAPSQEIWYLAASRIVSPNPVVKSDSDEVVVVLPSPTPDGETPDAGATTGPPTVTQEGEEPEEEPEEEPTEGPDPTRTPSPTFQSIPPTLPGPTATPRPTSTEEPTGGGTNTPTPSPSTTPTTAGDGTAVTGTPTTTPTATTAGATPGGTAEPADQGEIDFGYENNEKQTLVANSPHSWRFNPPAAEQITIVSGSVLDLNLTVDLVAPDGTVVEKANTGGLGDPETITYNTPNPTGEFRIIVSGENGTSGAYVLIVFDSSSVPVVVIQETINYGSGGSGSVPEDTDHFWNFEGQADDVITIEVSQTSASGDIVLYLIGPDGSELEFIDETEGGNENLVDYTLPATGFYSIGIGDTDFLAVDYTMTLTQ